MFKDIAFSSIFECRYSILMNLLPGTLYAALPNSSSRVKLGRKVISMTRKWWQDTKDPAFLASIARPGAPDEALQQAAAAAAMAEQGAAAIAEGGLSENLKDPNGAGRSISVPDKRARATSAAISAEPAPKSRRGGTRTNT